MFLMPVPVPVVPVVAAFTSSGFANPGATTHTFSGVAIGTASADRQIVVHGYNTGGGGGQVISTITVGGISASKLLEQLHTSNTVSSLWIASVSSGTTADIVFSSSASNFDAVAFGAWEVTGAASTTSDTLGDDAEPSTGTINVPANGALFAAGGCNSVGGATNTWTGVDESFEEVFSTNRHTTGGFKNYSALQSGLTVTMDWTTDGENGMVAISLAPV